MRRRGADDCSCWNTERWEFPKMVNPQRQKYQEWYESLLTDGPLLGSGPRSESGGFSLQNFKRRAAHILIMIAFGCFSLPDSCISTFYLPPGMSQLSYLQPCLLQPSSLVLCLCNA
ncbi:hypothetical protein BJX76DRAFT_70375 [Aspergillus varians]